MELCPHEYSFCKASTNLTFYWILFLSSLNPQQDINQCKQSPAIAALSCCCSVFQKVHQTLLMAAAHKEPAAPSGSLAKRHVYPQGWPCVSAYERLCLRPRCPLRQSNPQWQQVGNTKSHSSLAILLLSACERVKRRERQTKKALQDTGGKISSGKADWDCQTNLQHTWARKFEVIQPTRRSLGHLY